MDILVGPLRIDGILDFIDPCFRNLPDPKHDPPIAKLTDPDVILKLTELRELAIAQQIARGELVEIDGEYVRANPDFSFYNQTTAAKTTEDGISWFTIEANFQMRAGISDNTQIGAAIDYTAAVYEKYAEYIQSNFDGDERDKHMTTLHEIISQIMEKMADKYANDMGGFLEEYGVSGEKGVLKESVFAAYEEKFSAKLGMSLSDFNISAPDNTSGNLYSMDELLALGFLQGNSMPGSGGLSGQGQDWHNTYMAGFIQSAMKKESIYEAFSVSDSVKDKIETVFSNRINSRIDEHNKRYEEEMSKGFTYSEEWMANITPFNKETIWQIINGVLENMRSGMSAMEAVEKADSARNFTSTYGKTYDLFDVFFRKYDIVNNYGWDNDDINMATSHNKFLYQMGLIHQLSVNGIDWTV